MLSAGTEFWRTIRVVRFGSRATRCILQAKIPIPKILPRVVILNEVKELQKPSPDEMPDEK